MPEAPESLGADVLENQNSGLRDTCFKPSWLKIQVPEPLRQNS